MAAVAAATVAAATAIGSGEDHQALRVEVKIVGWKSFCAGAFFPACYDGTHDAISGKRRLFVAEFGRDFFRGGLPGNFTESAPAFAFVRGWGADCWQSIAAATDGAQRGVGRRRGHMVITGGSRISARRRATLAAGRLIGKWSRRRVSRARRGHRRKEHLRCIGGGSGRWAGRCWYRHAADSSS